MQKESYHISLWWICRTESNHARHLNTVFNYRKSNIARNSNQTIHSEFWMLCLLVIRPHSFVCIHVCQATSVRKYQSVVEIHRYRLVWRCRLTPFHPRPPEVCTLRCGAPALMTLQGRLADCVPGQWNASGIGQAYRWVPLYPNMDNRNSHSIQSPCHLSLQC